MTPREMMTHLARQAQAKRLACNWTQKTLSERSGVSYGVIKKFERTGQISLESLLRLALALDALKEFHAVFSPPKPEAAVSLDALINAQPRKRGRQ